MKRCSADSGQTLVEAAIVVPMLAAFFMCMLQVMVLAHARVLVEYAAFNAARAVIVNNASVLKMRQAAVLSMLPVYGRTDTLDNFGKTWALLMLPEAAGALADTAERGLEDALNSLFGGAVNLTGALTSLAPVEVVVLNPRASDCDSNGEIDLDLPSRLNPDGTAFDAKALQKTRLTIIVTALVPMKIPIGGRLIFYSYMIARYLATPPWRNDLQQWATLNFTTMKMEDLIANAPVPTNTGTLLSDVADSGVAGLINDALTYLALTQLALHTDPPLFLFPLQASQSMPMESNAFQGNLN